MVAPESNDFPDPSRVLEHFREGNRKFDSTIEAASYRLETCFEAQLGELGLRDSFYEYDEDGSFLRATPYIKPEALRVIIDAFMTGKMPQPEGRGSLLFSERTAIGRQSALDTAIERIRESEPYDITQDVDFYPANDTMPLTDKP